MMITQKSQYAMRAIFELARREGKGPVKISEIAEAQVIPQRFLENILNQLRQGGVVESRRGKEGGYLLARPASQITAGTIIRLVEGTIYAVECTTAAVEDRCPLHGDCVFLPLWKRASEALEAVYDETNFADLVRQERARSERFTLSYSI